MECTPVDRPEVFVPDNALEVEAFAERILFDDCELIGEGNALEGGALMECTLANSFEVFVADDMLEGGALDERRLFDQFELIGEGNALECGT